MVPGFPIKNLQDQRLKTWRHVSEKEKGRPKGRPDYLPLKHLTPAPDSPHPWPAPDVPVPA